MNPEDPRHERSPRDEGQGGQEEYAHRIQERFVQRRRAALTLSPADWQLIDEWWQRAIPLWIVLESIDAVFERKDRAGDAAPARRLSSCAREIEGRFSALGRARSGSREGPDAGEPDPLDELIPRIETAARELRDEGAAALASILERALEAIRDLPLSLDSVSRQLRLLEIDGELLRRFRESTPAHRLARLRAEAEEALGDHRERMTPEAFDSTVDRLLDERLRETYRIPPLTLT